MVHRGGGNRRKTRHWMTKPSNLKGKISIRAYLQDLNVGDSVVLKAESAVSDGLYFNRFHGKIAKVVGKQGFSYKVQLKDGSKTKTLFVHPVHLKKVSA
jgi:large subunit ribosomal protein L21e